MWTTIRNFSNLIKCDHQMIRKILLMISCLIAFSAEAVEGQKFHAEETLRKTAVNFLNFIDQISQGVAFSGSEAAAEIFSPDCVKVLNGRLFTQNREDFIEDLLSVYRNQGAWKIHPADLIIDSSSNTVVLRLFIEMEKWGNYTAIVILRCNTNSLITEINEVLSQVKGTYDFEM